MKKWLLYSFSCLLLLLLSPLSAQEPVMNLQQIAALVDQKKYHEARIAIDKSIRYHYNKKQVDTMLMYIIPKGELLLHFHNNNSYKSINALESYAYTLQKELSLNDGSMGALLEKIARFSENEGNYIEAYRITDIALQYHSKLKTNNEIALGRCENNLGAYALQTGNVEQAIVHTRRGVSYYNAAREQPLEPMYFAYSALANVFWYELNYDSAKHYYVKTLEIIKQLPHTPTNLYFRKAIVSNGLMAVYREEGKSKEAIDLGYEIIADYQKYIAGDTIKSKINTAKEALYETMDNLAGVYEETGNVNKAINLKLYSQSQKIQQFGGEYIGVYKSDILLAMSYAKIMKNDLALQHLDSGIIGLMKEEVANVMWLADAYAVKALIYNTKKNFENAQDAYNKASYYFEQTYGSSLDNIYTDFLRNKATFLAHQNLYDRALKTMDIIERYLKKNSTKNASQLFYYYKQLANIHLIAQQYSKALTACQYAETAINNLFDGRQTPIDSIKISYYTPSLILTKSKAHYHSLKIKDSLSLTAIYNDLNHALEILERRKMQIEDEESVRYILEDNKELIDFYSKIVLELNRMHPHPIYVDKFISLRENALYSSIRNRINKQQALKFSWIPQDLLDQEKQLKAALQISNSSTTSIENLHKAQKKWDEFLILLQSKYPKYYQLRYASLLQNTPNINKAIQQNTTLIRYYILDTTLSVLIATNKEQQLLTLPLGNLTEHIALLDQFNTAETKQLQLLDSIFQVAWKPIEKYINTPKVTIIPDGMLYNINFEMLPTKSVTNFAALAQNCLLHKFTITYNYSIWVLNQPKHKDEDFQNYIAFVPGFSDQLKEEYVNALEDSMFVDQTYLSLLPQPSSKKLAVELQNDLGGKVIEGKKATIQQFSEQANKHKVVHLATHAEYNNAIPELSGLYFSKNKNNENFFTLNDIYTTTINTDLMILTACESGKAGYQDGEGLVSLSHAFNYAGSSSILTALWNIDENASVTIIGQFMKAMQEGLTSDEALRKSKLHYIANHDGRLVAPIYWSGLILMGEPLNIDLQKQTIPYHWFLVGFGFIVVMLLIFYIYRKK